MIEELIEFDKPNLMRVKCNELYTMHLYKSSNNQQLKEEWNRFRLHYENYRCCVVKLTCMKPILVQDSQNNPHQFISMNSGKNGASADDYMTSTFNNNNNISLYQLVDERNFRSSKNRQSPFNSSTHHNHNRLMVPFNEETEEVRNEAKFNRMKFSQSGFSFNINPPLPHGMKDIHTHHPTQLTELTFNKQKSKLEERADHSSIESGNLSDKRLTNTNSMHNVFSHHAINERRDLRAQEKKINFSKTDSTSTNDRNNNLVNSKM